MEECQLHEKKLHKAALQGDTALLNQILDEDPLILRRVKVGCLVHTPLHVAAFEGKLEFVQALLKKNKGLAGVLDPRRWSALHLAAAQGHHDIVGVLVTANPDMCVTPDDNGRNPLHLAAIRGHLYVLAMFFGPYRCWIHELLKAKDAGGNTILHLATRNKKFTAMEFLLDEVKKVVIEENIQKSNNPLNVINENGYTALDILQGIKDESDGELNFKELKKRFREVDALTAKEVKQVEWLSKKQGVLMVVASLIATMAFQVGVSPPGGVWQENLANNSTNDHRAGEAVMAYNHPNSYPLFLHANTIGFVASVSTILFLMTGLPFKRNLFMWIMALIMWLAITFSVITYTCSITVITPKKYRGPLNSAISIGLIFWCGMMAFLVVAHTIHSLNELWKKIRYWLEDLPTMAIR